MLAVRRIVVDFAAQLEVELESETVEEHEHLPMVEAEVEGQSFDCPLAWEKVRLQTPGRRTVSEAAVEVAYLESLSECHQMCSWLEVVAAEVKPSTAAPVWVVARCVFGGQRLAAPSRRLPVGCRESQPSLSCPSTQPSMGGTLSPAGRHAALP